VSVSTIVALFSVGKKIPPKNDQETEKAESIRAWRSERGLSAVRPISMRRSAADSKKPASLEGGRGGAGAIHLASFSDFQFCGLGTETASQKATPARAINIPRSFLPVFVVIQVLPINRRKCRDGRP